MKIAVIDTGTNIFLKTNIQKNIDFSSGKKTVDKSVNYSNNSGFFGSLFCHGSLMMNIISSQNPNALIYSLNVFEECKDSEKNGYPILENIVNALRWCIENDMDVINISLGTNSDIPVLKMIIGEAANKGCIIVAPDIMVVNNKMVTLYPGSYNGVVKAKDSVDAALISGRINHKTITTNQTTPLTIPPVSITCNNITAYFHTCWHGNTHKKIIKESFMWNPSYMDYIMKSCVFCDGIKEPKENNIELFETSKKANKHFLEKSEEGARQLFKTSKEIFKKKSALVLHGRYNYISTLNYLYNVALEMKKPGSVLEKTLDKCVYKIKTNKPEWDDNNHLKESLKKAIKYMVDYMEKNEKILGISKSKNSDGINTKSLVVLGMALHLSGDIFAHKTRVPIGILQDEKTRIKGSFDEFKEHIEKGMMFNKINSYFEEEYEDNPVFFPVRYRACVSLSKIILDSYENDISNIDFAEKIITSIQFAIDNSDEKDMLQLAYLKKHIGEYEGMKNNKNTLDDNVIEAFDFIPLKGEY